MGEDAPDEGEAPSTEPFVALVARKRAQDVSSSVDSLFDACSIARLELRPDPAKGFDGQTDEITLAMLIYGEARGESRVGKVMVAQVVLNRLNDPHKRKWFGFKDGGASIKDIMLAPWQFSCFNANDPNRRKLLDPHTYDYVDCIKAARIVLGSELAEAGIGDLTDGATHYYAPAAANPSWAKSPKMVRTVECGGHLFFREEV